jgi:outer membrane receptor for ferrienterochelin and colicins
MKRRGITHHVLLAVMFGLYGHAVSAQIATVSGRITADNEAIPGATVAIAGLNAFTVTDADGFFLINGLKAGSYSIRASFIGYRTIEQRIEVRAGEHFQLDLELQLDILNLGEVVVTGTRNLVERYKSPVIVNSVNAHLFEATQSVCLADGLSFSPGLRVENNCQNCGFTQVRMNGLEGAYAQVLINSRPVFSGLAGVYGLEMLPTAMVERIEVVRGGGSVMYGGNAIAGTVNIITKNPTTSAYEVEVNQALVHGEASDRSVSYSVSVVPEDGKGGVNFFGYNRNRTPWDANGDGFSEIALLRSSSFGVDAFYDFNENRCRLKFGGFYINEFRRGGNKFDLVPHQTDITEQIEHDVLNTTASLDLFSNSRKHKTTMYGSLQHVDRASYYGGGGRVIGEGDTLTADDVLAINAYGYSEELTAVFGLQHTFFARPKWSVTAGSEFALHSVVDEMPGYGRLIDQRVGNWGTFTEVEVRPIERLTLLVGGRFDQLNLTGMYNLQVERLVNDRTIEVLVPRLSVLYSIRENLKLRASYAQGYRGPQAFDEDLHIETVGGAARFIRFNPDLQVERSNSTSLSINYDQFFGRTQLNVVAEGFYTHLTNPFLLTDQEELPSGVAVITKRNGEGAAVSGVHVEANAAFGSKFVLQSGATFQSALYDVVEELWTPDVPSDDLQATSTSRLLRTPGAYGFFSCVYTPREAWAISYSGVITGSMDVARVIDPVTEQTVITQTQAFFDNTIKAAYKVRIANGYKVDVSCGVQNIWNSYQQDFDSGVRRDAGYIYGPMRPRTIFVGLKFGFDRAI